MEFEGSFGQRYRDLGKTLLPMVLWEGWLTIFFGIPASYMEYGLYSTYLENDRFGSPVLWTKKKDDEKQGSYAETGWNLGKPYRIWPPPYWKKWGKVKAAVKQPPIF